MTVIDISGAGAAVLADRALAMDQTAWIKLDSGAAGRERLEARVVATSAEASGKHVVRVNFTSWLPLGEVLERHEEHRLWTRYPARETRANCSGSSEHPANLPGPIDQYQWRRRGRVTDAPLPAQEPIWLTL